MSDPDNDLRRSPLHDRHEALGARTAAFGGWEMPLEYPGGGVLKEHAAVREGVGVFDVSHLGNVRVRGNGAAELVDACLTNSLARIDAGQAQYTLACDDDTGGVVDDMIVYLIGPSDLVLVPNAANTDEVVRRLQAQAPDGIAVDVHPHAVLAVQGPRSGELMTLLDLPAEHAYMSFESATLGEVPVVVCRSGYTGERGYELMTPADTAGQVWDAMFAAGEPLGLRACGLGARDTLRTEMGYPLHGQDLGPEITPVQARLGWAVGWDKPAFWGRERLLAEREQGPTRRLRGLKANGRGIPRAHMTVVRPGEGAGEPVGEVTSGTFSPTLRTGIGLALLDSAVKEGDEVAVEVRGRQESFTVTRPPFVQTDVRG